MTMRLKLAAISLTLALVGFGAYKLYPQVTSTKVSELDREILKRTEAQLQALQMRISQEAAPIVSEHDAVYKKYCDKAGLVMGQGGNCQINVLTGEVSKIPPPPIKK